jgi:hypothetical protein
MNALFQADLSFLFEQPSIWLVLVETLIVLTPLAIALSGYAAWRVGDRRGLILIFWVCTYLLWMHWPQPLDPALVLPGRVVSVIGWFWLLGAWTRRVNWHEPLLLASNGLVVAFLLALFLTTAVASIRDIMGWDSPA